MDLIIGFVLAILGIIAAALSRQLADEFKAWTPWIIERLVNRAVRSLCEEQRERCKEEWLAHVHDTPGEVGKLIAAVGFLRASRAMSSGVTGFKRACDILFAASCLFLCFPLIFCIAIMIKAEDGGPIFVRQDRKWRGRSVRVFKFRTVVLDDPPRRSRVGSFVSRQHLDQLPILIHILRGDLTLGRPDRD